MRNQNEDREWGLAAICWFIAMLEAKVKEEWPTLRQSAERAGVLLPSAWLLAQLFKSKGFLEWRGAGGALAYSLSGEGKEYVIEQLKKWTKRKKGAKNYSRALDVLVVATKGV